MAAQRATAQRVIEELTHLSKQRYLPAYYFALVRLGMSETDEAFAWLEKAYEERSGFLAFVAVEPMLDPLRADARFGELARRFDLSV